MQRRRDERWARRGPLMTVLAEHVYRPLQLRAMALALAAADLGPAASSATLTCCLLRVAAPSRLLRRREK